MADGIPTATGNMKWRSDGIRKILTNEKYMGDALLQKTYTVDVLTKKRVANNGIVPQYYVENNHEAKEIDALREKKATVVTKDAEQEMLRKRINEMRHFLQTQTSRITEYDEQLVRRLIEKITVYDDKLIFEFKSDMTIELKR